MDTYEKGVRVGIGDCYPSCQRNEYVTVPGHHNPVAVGSESACKSLRDVQGHILLCYCLTWNSAAVVAAMTGIDHYSRARSAVLRSALGLSRRESPQKCDQQTGGEQRDPVRTCPHH